MKSQLSTVVVLLVATVSAHADVTISMKPTKNMNCSGGVCTPTAKKAVLNVNALTGMLATGNVTVKSDSRSKDIEIDTALSWAGTQMLTLDSYQSIIFKKPVVVTGAGAIGMKTNDGGQNGDFSFVGKAHIEFWDITSRLLIDNTQYTLVNSVAMLASKANYDDRAYALARDYDAKPDGVYHDAPIHTFFGILEGLGNHIQNLAVTGDENSDGDALIGLDFGLSIHNFGLEHVKIKSRTLAGALVATNGAPITNCYATGTISGPSSLIAGGLVGDDDAVVTNSFANVSINAGPGSLLGGFAADEQGMIINSHASGTIVSGGQSDVGGLVGTNGGKILQSYATGELKGAAQDVIGGLVGTNGYAGIHGIVMQSYATGAVSGGTGASVGGLIGHTEATGTGSQSYSIGQVSGGTNTGGLIGFADNSTGFNNMYWV